MNGSRKRTLIAGLVLLALTNAVALGGALWNRAGEPEARLRLSERELSRVEAWYGRNENSGLSLRTAWRVLVEPSDGASVYAWRYATVGGAPGWLDKSKMEALGFDVSAAAANAARGWARYETQLAREVLLVLELDGPAYRRALELVKEHVGRELAKPFAPDDKQAEQRRKNAQEMLDWETGRNSRLFVVDAGLDAEALRAKYPDRARYAIVRGEVRPWVISPKADKAAGYISSVSIPSVNVPLELRKVFADARFAEYDPRGRTAFEATIAWGRRLEPWLLDAATK